MKNVEALKQHEKHRKRLNERFVKTHGKGFADHELLELLLFYAIPRKNTNNMAHELCERFGTIDKIAEASIDELKLVTIFVERTVQGQNGDGNLGVYVAKIDGAWYVINTKALD